MQPDKNSLEQNFSGSEYDSSLESVPPQETSEVLLPGVSRAEERRHRRRIIFAELLAVIVISIIGVAAMIMASPHTPKQSNNAGKTPANGFSVKSLPLQGVKGNEQLQVGQADRLDVNGQLSINNTLVLSPTATPTTPVTGQIYYDKSSNQPYYYNGTQFVSLSPAGVPEHITSLGGAAGVIGLGSGLTINGNQLAVSSSLLQAVANVSQNAGPRVTSLQGLTGDITLTGGPGIGISGTTISNNGVIGLTSGSGNVTITNNGGGNYTISVNSGPAGVALGPSSAQTDASGNPSIFINNTGGSNLLDLENNGNPVFVVDNTGQITQGTIDFNQIQNVPAIVNSVGGASGALTLGAGLSVSGQALSNTGVLSVGGDSGAITLGTGLSESGNTLTNSGVTQLTGTANQISVSSGTGNITLSLPQDIGLASNVQFHQLTVGNSSSLGTLIFNDATGHVTTLQATAPSTQNQVITLPATNQVSGNDTVCLQLLGNCSSGFSGTGTTNTLVKFTGPSSLGNSGLTDNGSTVTIAGEDLTVGGIVTTATLQSGSTLNITPGGDLTVGATNQQFLLQGNASSSLAINANGHVTTISFAPPTSSDIAIGFPNESGTVCLQNSLNCGFATSGSGVTSLNLLTGTLSVANATTSGGNTIIINNASTSVKGIASFNSADFTDNGSGTISTVQPIGTAANVQFGSLGIGIAPTGTAGDVNLAPAGTLRVDKIETTATGGGNLSISSDGAGSNITFLINGGNDSFLFPTGGGMGQTICTTAITCASGGGQAVILEPGGGVQTASGNLTAVFINKASGTGDLIDLQAGGNDAFVIDNLGNTTISGGSLTTVTTDLSVGGTLGVNTITPTGALTIGDTGQQLTLQGNSSSVITATGGGALTTVGFNIGNGLTAPLGNVTYQFQNDNTVAPGTYNVCTTAGNCAGVGGSITGAGTTGHLSLFTGSNNIGDSVITQTGTGPYTVSVGGNLAVGVSGASQLSIGVASSADGKLVFNNSTNGNAVTIQEAAAPSSPVTLKLPNQSGTFAVAATGPLSLDATTGVLSCSTCLTGGGPGGGVASLDGLSGALTLANSSGSGSTVTINDALTDGATKGIATFNASNFKVTAGAINTIQDITTGSSPTFSNLTLQGSTGLSVGTSVASGNVGQIVFHDGTAGGFTSTLKVATITGSSKTQTLPNVSGTVVVGTGGAGSNLTTDATGGLLSVVSSPNFTGSVTAVGVNASTGLLQGGNGLTVTGNTVSLNASSNFATNINTGTSTGAVNIGNGNAGAISLQSASALSVATTNLNLSGTALAVGTSGTQASLALTTGTASRSVVIQGLAPSTAGNATINIPSIPGSSSDTVCLLTLNNCNGGSGGTGVTTPGGTTNFVAKFSGGSTVVNSQLFDNGTGVSVGNTSVTGLFNVGASNQFQVSSAGAVTAVGVDAGGGLLQGSAGLTVTGAAVNLNASSNFATNINTGSSTGAINIGNNNAGAIGLLSGGALTVTSSNFSLAGGALTVGVSGTQASLALTSGTAGRSIIIQGLAPSSAGNGTIQIPSIPGSSTDTVCLLTLNNCNGGSGGTGVTTAGGTTNYLSKFTGSSAIGNSILYDSGTGVTVSTVSNTSPTGLFNVGSTNQFQVSSAGAVTAVGVNSGTGLLQGTGGLTVTGGAASLNASSNFATNINTGSSTGAINIGNASAGAIGLLSGGALTVTTTNFGVSGSTLTVGAASSIGTLKLSNNSNANFTNVVATAPTGSDQTITIPATTNVGGTDTVCLLLLNNCNGGSGGTGVTTTGGTTNYLAKFSGTSTVANSILYDNGTGVTISTVSNTTPAGLLNVGSTNQFQVSSAGAVTAVGVNSGTGLIQGTGGLTLAGSVNVNTSGSGVTNINTGTGTGAINIGNNTAGAISLQSGTTLGITTTNFSLNTGSNTNLTVGNSGNQASLILTTATANRSIIIQGAPPSSGGNATINIPSIPGSSSDTVCLFTLGNCVGAGGAVSTSGGIQNYITKYTNGGATQLGNSLLYDNGTGVTISTISNTTPAGLLNVGSTNQFQVSSAGAVTAVGVNSGTGLLQGAGGLTITGATANINATGAQDTNIGNGGQVNIKTAGTVGAINVGNVSLGGAINFLTNGAFNINSTGTASSLTGQINIGASTAYAGAISIGGSNTTSFGLLAGAGTIGIGASSVTSNAASTIQIGFPAGGTNAQSVSIGSLSNSSNTVIQGGNNTTGLSLTAGIAGGAGVLALNANTVNVGTGFTGTTINIGSTNANASTVNIATGGNSTNAQSVTIGSNSDTANSLILEGGTCGSCIQIGNSSTAHGIQIATGNATQTVAIGSTNSSSTLSLQGGSSVSIGTGPTGSVSIGTSTSGGVTIGANNNTGTLTFGQSNAGETIKISAGALLSSTTNTIRIGTGNTDVTSAENITIGSALGLGTTAIQGPTIQLGASGSSTNASNISINNSSGANSGTVTIGGSGSTGTMWFGTSTAGQSLFIGSAAPSTGVSNIVNIGTANSITTGTTAVNIGSNATSGGSTSVTVNAGTTGITMQPAGGASNTGVLIKPVANTTAAFQIQNGTSASLLNADTTNMRLGVGVTYAAMTTPSSLASSPIAGGALAAGAYKYEVTAIDSAGGETPVSNEVTGTTAAGNLTNSLTWTAVSRASGYRVYRTAISGGTGTEAYLITVIANSYKDTGAVTLGSATPPSSNTAYVSTNVINNELQLSVGGNGTPTGQLYVSGTLPSSAVGSMATGASTSQVYVQGRYAYVVSNTNGANQFQIIDVSNSASPVAVGSASPGNPTAIFVQGHYAYIVLANTLKIYDVSNPSSPSSVGSVTINGNNIRSIYVQGRYAYVTNNSSNTLQIFDVSNPASPTSVGTVATGNSPTKVYVQGRYAYVTNNSSNTLQIFDVSNPASPTSVGTVATGNSPDAVYVQGRYAYLANSSTGSALQIFDVSNPASPTNISSIGTGSGTSPNPTSVYVQGRYAYVVINGANTMNVYDVSNPTAPVSLGTVATGTSSTCIYVQGRYAYVCNSSTPGSLKIFDLGGTYTQQLEAGGTETGTLQVDTNATIAGDATIQGGLNVGQSIQTTGNLGVSGNTFLGGTLTVAGGVQGGLTVNGLSTPGAPTVTTQGTAGAVTWSYKVVAVSASGGLTPASAAGNTTSGNGNATLTSSNYQQITWTPVAGAVSYKIYRTAVGTSPATTGLIGTTSATNLNDTGLAGDGSTAAILDTSGQVTVNSYATFKNTVNSATAFSIQNQAGTSLLNADTGSMNVTLRAGTDVATVGSEMMTGSESFPTGSGWTSSGTGTSATTTHSNGGGTTAVSPTPALSINGTTVYQVTYTISGTPAAGSTLAIALGGNSGPAYTFDGTSASNFTDTAVITASTGANLSFTPSTTFNGTVSGVSVKVLTQNTAPVLSVKNVAGNVNLEVRASSSTNNLFIGGAAGESSTTGTFNSAVGTGALQSNTTGGSNAAFGSNALQVNTTGSWNSAFGTNALTENTIGNFSTAVGGNALQSNSVGNWNTAVGYNTLHSNTIGGDNTGLGYQALNFNTTGLSNTAIGAAALQNSTTGNYNLALGQFSLNSNTTGSNNTAIGQGADVLSGNLSNATAIGSNAQVGQSNTIVLGYSAANGLNDQVGIGTSTPSYELSVVNGPATGQVASFLNTTTTDSTNTQLLRLGLGVTSTTTNGRFVQFYGGATTDTNGTAVGHININNNAVNYGTAGADYAEFFDAKEPVTTGDIVEYADGGVAKAQGNNIVGVVSDHYGFSGNYQEGDESNPNRAAVGLLGQIKVNVTGGPIAIGDPVGVSSTPGVGQKMAAAGQIVGYAEEAFAGGTSGTINVYVNPGYYSGSTSVSYLQNGDSANFSSLNVSGATTLSDLTVTGTATIGSLTVTSSAHFKSDIIVDGHVITAGGQPVGQAEAAAGTAASVSVSGTDTTGTITINTGASPTAGALSDILFSKTYGAAPHVVLSPSNNSAAGLRFYKGTTTATNFMFNALDTPAPNTTYTFDYFVAQ